MQKTLKSRYSLEDLKTDLSNKGISSSYSEILRFLLDENIELRIKAEPLECANNSNYIITSYKASNNYKYLHVRKIINPSNLKEDCLSNFIILLDDNFKTKLKSYQEQREQQTNNIEFKITIVEGRAKQPIKQAQEPKQKTQAELAQQQELKDLSYADNRKLIDKTNLFITSQSYKELLIKLNITNSYDDILIRENYPQELKIAVEAYEHLYIDNTLPKGKADKAYIESYLSNNYPKLSNNSIERIATLINPNKKGGAPKM